MQYILGTKSIEEKEQKFKNTLAKKMFDRLQKHAKKQKKVQMKTIVLII